MKEIMQMTGSKSRKSQRVDYDSPWKDIIETLFEDFLKFFFPEIRNDIDFSKKPLFISKELRKFFKDSKVGKRFADVLVKVYLLDGSTQCIFIHVEVQGTPDEKLPERVYVYNYRIYDYHRESNEEVVSLLILADEDENFRPDEYYVKRWSFEHRMKIPMVKIIDFSDKIQELEKSDNPMSMIVLAQLKSFAAKKADTSRKYDIKFNLYRECYRKGYNKNQIIALVSFIDWVINLPDKYQEKLNQELTKLEEDSPMPYVTNIERVAKKYAKREGKREGIREGKREGKREGIKEQALNTARKMLEDNLPIEAISKYTGLPKKDINALMI
jgi:hypothetical protein